jgi:hypothetical protein
VRFVVSPNTGLLGFGMLHMLISMGMRERLMVGDVVGTKRGADERSKGRGRCVEAT